jgi:hypothetical protein
MKTSELKTVIKECVREILQEDDLISNIIIQSFKASEALRESSSRNISETPKKSLPPQKPKNTNMKDVWKKVLEAKKPNREQLNEYGEIDTIDIKDSNSDFVENSTKQDFNFMDMITESKHEEKIEVQEDKELMNFFAKKFKK